MKKIICMLIAMIILCSLFALSAYADTGVAEEASGETSKASTSKEDKPYVVKKSSLDVSDEERALVNAEKDDVVLYVYRIAYTMIFCEEKNIQDALNSGYLHAEYLYVQKPDQTCKTYNLEGDEMFSNRWNGGYEDGKEMDPFFFIRENELNAVFTDFVFDKIEQDVKIENVYLLYGDRQFEGTAVYYETNIGDFVYTTHFSSGNDCLMPIKDFWDFMKKLMDWWIEHGDKDIGVSYNDEWDLSNYDINSEKFKIDLANARLEPEDTELVPAPKATIDQTIVLPVAIVCIAACAGVVCVFVMRKKAKG